MYGGRAIATLSIRNLPEEDHKLLRRRAAHHGVSIEAEVRAILHQVLNESTRVDRPRRLPPASIAGKGRTLGDLVAPLADESDWECLR